MDPLLLGIDLAVVVLGLILIRMGIKGGSRKPSNEKIYGVIVAVGVALVVSGPIRLPSKSLQAMTTSAEQMVATDPSTTNLSDDELPSTEGEQNDPMDRTIIISPTQEIAELLRANIEAMTKMKDTCREEDQIEIAYKGTEDPIEDVSAAAQASMEPTETVQVIQVAPVRVTTLEHEPDEGPPLCTEFRLLNDDGPHPSGCHVIGCAQGYALPMLHLQGGGWDRCQAIKRVPRVGDCYVVTNAAGSETGRTFKDDQWVDCPLS